MEPNGESPEEGCRDKSYRFEYLLNRYLDGNATEREKEELKNWVDNGYEEEFLSRITKVYLTDTDNAPLPDSSREEILSNILGHVPERPFIRPFWRSWAAAAVVFLGFFLGWQFFSHVPDNAGNASEGAHYEHAEDIFTAQGKQFVTLPDGSTILLNDHAEIRFDPSAFAQGRREIHLRGEAYFDVTKMAGSDFLVHTGSIATRVLGTAFNIAASDSAVVVTVDRGLVEVRDQSSVFAQISPDEQIVVDTQTHQFITRHLDVQEEIAWKKDLLVFHNTSLNDAINSIGRHFGVKVDFSAEEAGECRLTATFLQGEDLTTVLNVVTEMIGATYSRSGDKIVIVGGACK